VPVVFWHALGDHSGMQMAEAGPILAREYGLRVVAIDAPGFGASVPRLPDDKYEVPELVALSRELLDALGLDRPAWVGSSWGAYLGVAFAGAHPSKVRAVALLDGGHWDDPEEPMLTRTLHMLRMEERARPGYRWPSWEAANAEFRTWAAGRWTDELEAYVRSVLREENGEVVSIMGPDVMAAALYGLLHIDLVSAQERLGRSSVPVMLLYATEEPDADIKKQQQYVEEFQARVPQAEVRPVNAPHLMLEAKPHEVAKIIGPWLRTF
jgi:pimeloyl-ACP methyl ester carboxylesterase